MEGASINDENKNKAESPDKRVSGFFFETFLIKEITMLAHKWRVK